MKILHVLDHSIPLHSGYTFRTRSILIEQRKRGWETFHVTGNKQEDCAVMEEAIEGFHFYRTPLRGSWMERLPVLNQLAVVNSLTQRLSKIIPIIEPDVLHAHSPLLNTYAALKAGKKFNLPVVYDIRAFWEDAAVDHGTTTENSLRYRTTRWLDTRAVNQAHAVTTICHGLKRDLIERGVAPEKITLIPNAVDAERFEFCRPKNAELQTKLGLNDAFVIGFIGSFYAYEGLDTLIAALPKIRRAIPNLKVVLVGGGFEEARLQAQVKSLGAEDIVQFTGRVPHEVIQDYYSLIDVSAYPRKSMRLTELVTPLKPLEAMAQGNLFVASDVGGHHELIEHGKTGMLFKAGDRDALAETIIQLHGSPQTWQPLRENGRHFVTTERTWANSVANYEHVYSTAKERHQRGQA